MEGCSDWTQSAPGYPLPASLKGTRTPPRKSWQVTGGLSAIYPQEDQVASLSDSEKALLKKLQEKSEAPDAPPISKSVSATVDLSNQKSIDAAIKHGFLTADEVEEMKDDDKKDKKGDATPRRRGYFKDGDKEGEE